MNINKYSVVCVANWTNLTSQRAVEQFSRFSVDFDSFEQFLSLSPLSHSLQLLTCSSANIIISRTPPTPLRKLIDVEG